MSHFFVQRLIKCLSEMGGCHDSELKKLLSHNPGAEPVPCIDMYYVVELLLYTFSCRFGVSKRKSLHSFRRAQILLSII